MAHKKSSKAGTVSNGGRQKANVAHEEIRQAKFARRREAGKGYKYKKNPYPVDSQEYQEEAYIRQQKVLNSGKKLEYARLQSFFAKLDNYLNAERLKAKESNLKK